MSDAVIFSVGVVTFLLFAGGIFITVTEVRRLGAEATHKLLTTSTDAPLSKHKRAS